MSANSTLYAEGNLSQPLSSFVHKEAPLPEDFAASCCKIALGHIMVLTNKLKTENERLWYGLQAIEHGWPRAIWLFQNML